ncbi:MAG: hypothetical protein ACLTLQ_17340 [[Clostridium] scindens]
MEHGAKFTMESGTITGNTNANEGGGGIFAHDGATVNLNGGTIENNSAYYGAGICIINAQVYLNGTDVENNTSIRNGAGIYIGNDGYGSYSSYDLTTRLAMTSGAIREMLRAATVEQSWPGMQEAMMLRMRLMISWASA